MFTPNKVAICKPGSIEVQLLGRLPTDAHPQKAKWPLQRAAPGGLYLP